MILDRNLGAKIGPKRRPRWYQIGDQKGIKFQDDFCVGLGGRVGGSGGAPVCKFTAYEWDRVITKSIDLKPILVRKMAPEIDPNRRGFRSIFWIDFWSDFGSVLEVLWDPCGAHFWD